MKERPILFSGEMILATLDDRKTKTRRVIKNLRVEGPWWIWQTAKNTHMSLSYGERIKCPYGEPSDRLWVRETWRVGAWSIDRQAIAVDYRADGYARREWLIVEDDELWERLWIQSSDDAAAAGLPLDDEGFHWEVGQAPTRWRPSIYMPRWASRILLEITDIRVERVQEITDQDAKAEGVTKTPYPHKTYQGWADGIYQCLFKDLWDSINVKPKPVMKNSRLAKLLFSSDILNRLADNIVCYVSYPWDDVRETREYRGKPWFVYGNPWIWVISFKKLA